MPRDYEKEARNYLKSMDSLEGLSKQFTSLNNYESDGSIKKRDNYKKSYYVFKEYDSFKSQSMK